jgi:hypothetical protein
MAYKVSNSRIAHQRSEDFDSLAEAMAAAAMIPGATLADIVHVRSGMAEVDEAAVKALEAAKAHQAEHAKAMEAAAAEVVALAEALEAQEPQQLH